MELQESSTTYVSRSSALARSFFLSRNNWKSKYAALREKLVAVRTTIRDLTRSRDKWRGEAEALKQENLRLRELLQQSATSSPPAPREATRALR